MIESLTSFTAGSQLRWIDSTAAQRMSLLPSLLMCPRRTVLSDS